MMETSFEGTRHCLAAWPGLRGLRHTDFSDYAAFSALFAPVSKETVRISSQGSKCANLVFPMAKPPLKMVEHSGFEPLTFSLRTKSSTLGTVVDSQWVNMGRTGLKRHQSTRFAPLMQSNSLMVIESYKFHLGQSESH